MVTLVNIPDVLENSKYSMVILNKAPPMSIRSNLVKMFELSISSLHFFLFISY